MIIGVKYQISQNEKYFLEKALNQVNSNGYKWHFVDEQSEILNYTREKNFFDKEIYTNIDFFEKIKEPSFIVFLKLQAYPNDSNIDLKNIENIDFYLESACQLLVLVYDCEFVEIFAKDENTLKTIHNNAIANGFFDVSYITSNKLYRFNTDIL